ncbi:MAG: hypothetical protein IJ261_05360 [Clostridia bacterium]|nr:hypothetical protein [Clostridia bacterium]
MINSQTVLFRLRQLVTLDEEGAENALPLCQMCLEEVMSRLKPDADVTDPRIAQAAAALACYRTAFRDAADNNGATSFKAGDVTVTRTPAAILETACMIRDEAFIQAADLLTDRDFVFRQVGE